MRFDALGLEVTRPTPIWWTVATLSRTGHLRTSAVHSFTALPRFTNEVKPSPYLIESRRGLLGAAEKTGAQLTSAGPPHIRLASGFDFAPALEGPPALALQSASVVPPSIRRTRAARAPTSSSSRPRLRMPSARRWPGTAARSSPTSPTRPTSCA
jgi:hypothetical protein